MREWKFGPYPKIDRLVYRSVPPSRTLERVREKAKLVPITRVSDLTPLDRLKLPVYAATTPLARDLTTHLGKGLDHASAQLSAMMEAVERVSAERPERPIRRESFTAFGKSVEAVDPTVFDLPDDTQFRKDQPISWIEGWDLVQQKPVWIPVDLAITPPNEGVLLDVDTNGLAAGNTLLEAVVHGICEVIERDAMGIRLFKSLYAAVGESLGNTRAIIPKSLPPECQMWRKRISDNGLSLVTELLESEIGIPVFRSVIVDPAFPSSTSTVRSFVGFGASPNATSAVVRSITEAVQSRLAVVQGARDSFNSLPLKPKRSAHRLPLTETAGEAIPFRAIPSFNSDDLRDDLLYLLGRLHASGFGRVIAVNLTRRRLDIPVIRIRVPGLSSFAVNRRRPGWRCLRHLL
jgi:ribosomal protein S12 methylthiotransferase accessory factor